MDGRDAGALLLIGKRGISALADWAIWFGCLHTAVSSAGHVDPNMQSYTMRCCSTSACTLPVSLARSFGSTSNSQSILWQTGSLTCADSLVPEAKPKVDDKASSKASCKPESPAAASAEPGASLKYPSDAKSARPALGGLLRLNAHKDAAAQQVCPSRPRAAL